MIKDVVLDIYIYILFKIQEIVKKIWNYAIEIEIEKHFVLFLNVEISYENKWVLVIVRKPIFYAIVNET